MSPISPQDLVLAPEPLLDILGGIFASRLRSEADVLSLINHGISDATYFQVATRLELPKDAIGAETTIRNRLKKEAKLNPDESERLVQIARVYANAVSTFGSSEKALNWMRKPAKYLPDEPLITPMALASRDAGVRLLEEKLLRTAHGVF